MSWEIEAAKLTCYWLWTIDCPCSDFECFHNMLCTRLSRGRWITHLRLLFLLVNEIYVVMGHVGWSYFLYGCSFYFCLGYVVTGFWPWFRDMPVNQWVMFLHWCTASLVIQFVHSTFRSLKTVTVKKDAFHKTGIKQSRLYMYTQMSPQPASDVGLNVWPLQ